mmetsp:Transcript_35765/g.56987  ORF Transcript_35765/g.56987 Transcript_35765/m.56987 type:complete len:203 (-) Transcript_35765:320-928(-)
MQVTVKASAFQRAYISISMAMLLQPHTVFLLASLDPCVIDLSSTCDNFFSVSALKSCAWSCFSNFTRTKPGFSPRATTRPKPKDDSAIASYWTNTTLSPGAKPTSSLIPGSEMLRVCVLRCLTTRRSAGKDMGLSCGASVDTLLLVLDIVFSLLGRLCLLGNLSLLVDVSLLGRLVVEDLLALLYRSSTSYSDALVGSGIFS